MSSFDHIFLYCLMLGLAIIYDNTYRYNTSQRGKSLYTTKICAVILALTFIITEGLRYGRGRDQIENYGPYYLKCLTLLHADENYGKTFVLFNKFIRLIDPTTDDLTFGLIFVVIAVIFWYCLWQFYKDYRDKSKWFLFFAILATLFTTENTIRQGLSFSFILLGLHLLEHKKMKSMLLCVILSLAIHPGNIVTVGLLVASYCFFKNKHSSWKITVPIFILLEFIVQIDFVIRLQEWLSASIDVSFLGSKFQNYIDADGVNYREALQQFEDSQRSTITQLLAILFYSSILILCDKLGKIDKAHMFIFNVVVVGILTFEPFHLGGSLFRLFLNAEVLWFVPLSIALYNYRTIAKKTISKYAVCIAILYVFLYNGRFIFLNPDATYVWWNEKGAVEKKMLDR